MNQSKCAIILALFFGTVANAEPPAEQSKAVTIPLDQVWAYRMPGTRDIRELNPSGKDLVELIQQSLGRNVTNNDTKRGFVVQSGNKSALQQVYDVLVLEKPTGKEVRANRRAWIVFFSHDSSYYVYLHEVQRTANHIIVRYRFVPHDSKEMTRHFALIPIGTLPAGQYTISVVNSPMEQCYIDGGYRPIPESYTSKIVCRSFEFAVDKDPNN